MPDHIDVAFTCTKCGNKVLWKEDLRDNEVVTCPNCGQAGPTLGELKKASLKAAQQAVEKITGKGIKWNRK
jgi:DNA-directed RNA polymerase subunit RPC12/RpoP